MKVLLVAVNAKYIHSNLAVYDLKAYTENIPVEVELAEYTIISSRKRSFGIFMNTKQM